MTRPDDEMAAYDPGDPGDDLAMFRGLRLAVGIGIALWALGWLLWRGVTP